MGLSLTSNSTDTIKMYGGCRVGLRCWETSVLGVLLMCIIVGQVPIMLSIGAGGGCCDCCLSLLPYLLFSSSLWEMAR